MNPKAYIVEVQDHRTGYWSEVCQVPVEYETREESHRILWWFTVRQTVVTNWTTAIKAARQTAWQQASEQKAPVRIMSWSIYEDDPIGYQTEVWRDGVWKC